MQSASHGGNHPEGINPIHSGLKSEPGITIRRMCQADLEQVQEIDRLSFSLPWPAKAYAYELNGNPNSLQWVAEWHAESLNQPAQVVGLIVLWMILDEAHIATIAVRPEFRARSIAQQLLAAALPEAARRGAIQATLEVRESNLAARKLYQRFGFKLVGERPRYYKDNNENALIMTLPDLGKEYLSWLENQGWKKDPNPTREAL